MNYNVKIAIKFSSMTKNQSPQANQFNSKNIFSKLIQAIKNLCSRLYHKYKKVKVKKKTDHETPHDNYTLW